MANKHLSAINNVTGTFYITYNPILAKIFGQNEALLLGCLIYWIGRGADPRWIYKASYEIQNETALSEGQIKRAISNLRQTPYFKCEVHGLPATRHFFIDHELLQNDLPSLCEMHKLDGVVERNKKIINGRSLYIRNQNNIKANTKELRSNSIGAIISNRPPP